MQIVVLQDGSGADPDVLRHEHVPRVGHDLRLRSDLRVHGAGHEG